MAIFFILSFTNWFPNNKVLLRFRGFLVRPFFYKCGKNLRIGRNLVFYNPSKICIGNDVYIAYGCWFSAGAEIIIKDEVTMGPYCVITSNQHQRSKSSYFQTGAITSPILIEKGCWLGSHSVITAGCTIGSGSVLGAGAICTTDIPKNVLACGVPAKIFKNLE